MKQLMSRASGAVLPGVLVVSLCFPLASHAATCESLARLTLDNTKITIAQEVAPGTFTPPGVARQGGAPPQVPRVYAALPAFCRVAATLTPAAIPTSRSKCGCPRRGWNGKVPGGRQRRMGGHHLVSGAGQAVAAATRAASTDTGHVGNSGGVRARPSREGDRLRLSRRARDDGARRRRSSTPSTARAPKLSIWNGCSQGGGKASPKPQRYPADFDAIIAGAPAVNWMHLHAGARWRSTRRATRAPASVHPASEVPGDPPGGARRVRRARRRRRTA